MITRVDRLAMLTFPRVVAETDVTDLLCCHDLDQLQYDVRGLKGLRDLLGPQGIFGPQ